MSQSRRGSSWSSQPQWTGHAQHHGCRSRQQPMAATKVLNAHLRSLLRVHTAFDESLLARTYPDLPSLVALTRQRTSVHPQMAQPRLVSVDPWDRLHSRALPFSCGHAGSAAAVLARERQAVDRHDRQERIEAGEVLGVRREQGKPFGDRVRRDHQISEAASRLATRPDHCCGDAP